MEGNAGSGVQPLLRPPVPHRATNHSSILESESLARKGTPYLLKSPEITKEEPWFPSQSILRCSKPRRGCGSHPERHSGDRGGVCWAEEGMAMFLRCCFQHLSLPRGLPVSVCQCVCLSLLTSEHKLSTTISPITVLTRKAGRNQRSPSSVSKHQPTPSPGFSRAKGPLSLLVGS